MQPATLTGLNMTAHSPNKVPRARLLCQFKGQAQADRTRATHHQKKPLQTESSSSCSHTNTEAVRRHQTSVASGSTGTSSLATSPYLLLQCFL
jgi:hypothetical protein